MEENVDYSQILVPCRPSLDDQYVQLKPPQTWCALAGGGALLSKRRNVALYLTCWFFGKMKTEVLLVL